jgi:hypothetical protein
MILGKGTEGFLAFPLSFRSRGKKRRLMHIVIGKLIHETPLLFLVNGLTVREGSRGACTNRKHKARARWVQHLDNLQDKKYLPL